MNVFGLKVMAMLDLKQMFLDKSRAQGLVITIAILVEIIGVSLVALAIVMIHRKTGGISANPSPLTSPAIPIDRVNAAGGGVVVLIAMIILFGAATYFTGRLYGQVGYIACAIGFVVVVGTLGFLGGWGIG